MPLAHLGNKKYYLGMFFKVVIEDIMWIMMMLWWVNTSFVCLFNMNAQNFVLTFLSVIKYPKRGSPEEGDNFVYIYPKETDERKVRVNKPPV